MPRLTIYFLRAALLHFLVGWTAGAWMLLAIANPDLPALPGRNAHIDGLFVGFMTQFAVGTAYWILPRHPGGYRGSPMWMWVSYVLLNLGVGLSEVTLVSGVEILWGARLVQVVGLVMALVVLFPRARAFRRSRRSAAGGAAIAFAFCLVAAEVAAAPVQPKILYQQVCAGCHGPDRLGGMGPPLLPVGLEKLRGEKLTRVIANGRPFTQMPAFGEALSAPAIEALAQFLRTDPPDTPQWRRSAVEQHHKRLWTASRRPTAPVHGADPLNLFVVVETGDHHVTILDGDHLIPLDRFPSHFALHGGAKFSPDGRVTYLASRDGWITSYDLWALTPLAEVRTAIHTRNIAVSPDGRWVMAANELPAGLAVHTAPWLHLQCLLPVTAVSTKPSRISAVYQARPRRSFLVALRDIPELWEIPVAETPSCDPGSVRRIRLPEPMDDFFFDSSYRYVLGSDRTGNARVVDLNLGKEIARLPLPGLPHLGSGISWTLPSGESVMATTNLKTGEIAVINVGEWSLRTTIETLGPGFFLRSHTRSNFAWTDVFFGPHRDVMHVIDKRTLEQVKTLRPAPGKTAAHVEFDRHGRLALVSVWENAPEGQIVVYDAETLTVRKRLPMNKPVGKYNVYNKITFDEGTSH